MHILITNDDGLEAESLPALYAALAPFAELSVVVPDVERSSCGHAVRLREPIPVHAHRHPTIGSMWVVEGWPADCVRLALATLLPRPVDWVISGINRGANVGVDVFYSGTVAAAREAAIHGLPAVAFSQLFRTGEEILWTRVAHWAAGIFRHLSQLPSPRPHIWNVNFPIVTEDPAAPVITMAPLSIDPMPLTVAAMESADLFPDGGAPSGDQITPQGFRYGDAYFHRLQGAGTDVQALFSGKVVITPLSLQATYQESLHHPMPEWEALLRRLDL